MKPFAIILFGSPGSGKSTQATLLAQKYALTYFDTGRFLRRYLFDAKKVTALIREERKRYNGGALNTPAFVLNIIGTFVKKFAQQKESLVFAGSPRTVYEAIGGPKQTGFIQLLEKTYGKNRVLYFKLDLNESEAKKRNKHRIICSSCSNPLMGSALKLHLTTCPFCGGKMIKRADDTDEVIEKRFRAYHEQTEPIFKEIRKRGYTITPISATPLPYKIFENLSKKVDSLLK